VFHDAEAAVTTLLTMILAAPAVLLGAVTAIVLVRLPPPAIRLTDDDLALRGMVYTGGSGAGYREAPK
jgi:hypothetical protein